MGVEPTGLVDFGAGGNSIGPEKEGRALSETIAIRGGVDLAGSSHRRVALVVLAVFALALTIRVIDLGGRSLWVDEGATAVNSRLGLDQILGGEDQDFEHPPGYYALINLTSRISDSEAGLRLPSAVASALAAAVTYLVGRRLGGHLTGLLAAAILIVSPIDLWYAQEARQPALAALAIIGGIWGLARRDWLGYSVALVALVLGLYFDYITAAGWFAAGAIWTMLWRKADRARILDWLVVTAAAAIIYAPIEGAEFMTGFRGLLGYEGAGIWYGDILGSNPVTSNAIGLLAVAAVMVAIAFAVLNRLTGRGRAGAIWTALIVIAFALGSALTPIPRAYSVKKVLVVGWPVLALIIAYLIVMRAGAGWRRPMVIGLLATSLVGSAASFFVPKDDWRGATAYVNAHSVPGDVAWTREDTWAADAYFYYQGALPVHLDPSPDEEDLPLGHDVWLISYRRPQDPGGHPSIQAEQWFDENWDLVEEVPFYRLAVRHYVAP
jgi:hypothetical protein